MKQIEVIRVPAHKTHVSVPNRTDLWPDSIKAVDWLEPAEARLVQLHDRKVVVYRERG